MKFNIILLERWKHSVKNICNWYGVVFRWKNKWMFCYETLYNGVDAVELAQNTLKPENFYEVKICSNSILHTKIFENEVSKCKEFWVWITKRPTPVDAEGEGFEK